MKFSFVVSCLLFPSFAQAGMRVAVTGAGGQTGGHVFRKMQSRPQFQVLGIARSEASRKALEDATGSEEGATAVVDVAAADSAALLGALAGCAALVICTSAKVKPTGGMNEKTGRPNMGFPDGQPYYVDWLGQKRQIDAAKEAGVGHVVICSSMGGTDPNHMLNNFGRSEDGKSGGGILLWKRKAEKYLIDSGLTYTIVHPGGLLNDPGGRRKLIVGVDDKGLPSQNRSIPREDVAEVLVQSLLHESYKNRSVDLVSEPDCGSDMTTDFVGLLDPLSGASCDYTLGHVPTDEESKVEEDALRSKL